MQPKVGKKKDIQAVKYTFDSYKKRVFLLYVASSIIEVHPDLLISDKLCSRLPYPKSEASSTVLVSCDIKPVTVLISPDFWPNLDTINTYSVAYQARLVSHGGLGSTASNENRNHGSFQYPSFLPSYAAGEACQKDMFINYG